MQQRAPKMRLFALAAVICAATAPSSAAAGPALATKGHALLQQHCSRCHAISTDDVGSHAKAPPFRDVMKRYPAENLAEALAEGIVSGHPDMPEFVFKPDEVDAIVVYLDALAARQTP